MDIFSISEQRIVPPNITLHPLWEGECGASPVRLICTLSGYFPDGLKVEWKQDNEHLSNVGTQKVLQSVEGVKKTFSLSSEIVPNIKEWAGGSMYTCKSVQNKTEFIKTTSICQRKYIVLHSTMKKIRSVNENMYRQMCFWFLQSMQVPLPPSMWRSPASRL